MVLHSRPQWWQVEGAGIEPAAGSFTDHGSHPEIRPQPARFGFSPENAQPALPPAHAALLPESNRVRRVISFSRRVP